MSHHRPLYFKLERLNSSDVVVEEKQVQLVDGEVKISYDDINRRSCAFTLVEALPDTWMSSRWKPYYGIEMNGTVVYYPLGVFLPVNPSEDEELSGYVTKYQGVDKASLLSDAYSDIPLTFTAGTPIKSVASTIFAMIGETKLNLENLPYTLATDFTFEEGVTLEHILSTLIRSFTADWYYDVNGVAVLQNLPAVTSRPVRQNFTEGDDAIHIETTRSFETDKYWNKVVLVGGRADTGIFRQAYTNSTEVTRAGRTIARFFKEDTATSQNQVNELATQLLEIGIRMPANITIKNLPLVELEPKQVIQHNFVKYEVISFNIPLSTDLQIIQAGEVQ